MITVGHVCSNTGYLFMSQMMDPDVSSISVNCEGSQNGQCPSRLCMLLGFVCPRAISKINGSFIVHAALEPAIIMDLVVKLRMVKVSVLAPCEKSSKKYPYW